MIQSIYSFSSSLWNQQIQPIASSIYTNFPFFQAAPVKTVSVPEAPQKVIHAEPVVLRRSIEERIGEHRQIWQTICAKRDFSRLDKPEEWSLLELVRKHWKHYDTIEQCREDRGQLAILRLQAQEQLDLLTATAKKPMPEQQSPPPAISFLEWITGYFYGQSLPQEQPQEEEEEKSELPRKLQEQIDGLAQEKGLSPDEAKQIVIGNLQEMILQADKSIARLLEEERIADQTMLDNEERVMLSAIVLNQLLEAREQSKNSSGLLMLAQMLLDNKIPLEDVSTAIVEQATATSLRPVSLESKELSPLDRAISFHDEEGALIHREGSFLVAIL